MAFSNAKNDPKAAASRLKLRTAATNQHCMCILGRPRRQARPSPCHCFPSPNLPSLTGAPRGPDPLATVYSTHLSSEAKGPAVSQCSLAWSRLRETQGELSEP